MKVFDLICEHGHRFEGWFVSAERFAAQRDALEVHCPLCESSEITRSPSAPRLNLSGDAAPAAQAQAPATASDAQRTARQWLDRIREVVAKTEDVGPRFAEEARRIHYEETPARAIRGTATDDEQRELHDEGIETVRLPVPRALTETLQ